MNIMFCIWFIIITHCVVCWLARRYLYMHRKTLAITAATQREMFWVVIVPLLVWLVLFQTCPRPCRKLWIHPLHAFQSPSGEKGYREKLENEQNRNIWFVREIYFLCVILRTWSDADQERFKIVPSNEFTPKLILKQHTSSRWIECTSI